MFVNKKCLGADTDNGGKINLKGDPMIEFKGFNKIPRYSRNIIVTEKIDGTNAQITITDVGEIFFGSRNRWITPENDNHGFAKWGHENKDELLKLGVGTHYGEWWGCGIQRGYGQLTKKFSLFNNIKWNNNNKPACCNVVPVLYWGIFDDFDSYEMMHELKIGGSLASPGYNNPEGIVIYHIAGNCYFKKTFEKDNVKYA